MGLTRIRAQQISDIDYKQAVRVISTSNVTLTGGAPASVDGVSLLAGDRILVNGQSTGSENGLYRVQTVGTGSNGTWVRTTDANETGEIQAGMVVMVTEGNSYADSQWKLTTNDPIVVGTTALTFVINIMSVIGGSNTQIQFNSSGELAGSANLTWDGSQLYVNGSGNVTGNITGGNIITLGTLSTTSLTASGNISGGNINTAGQLKSTGTFVIGTQQFYAQGNDGFSVNENFNAGNSTVTAYHYTSGAGRSAIVFDTAVTGQFTTGFGTTGNAASNKFVFFAEFGNTFWEWRKSVGIQAPNLNGGTLLANISADGNLWTAGTITGTGNITGGNLITNGQVNANDLVISGNVTGDLLPAANITYDLGSDTQRWNDLYLANSTIYLGNAEISANSTSLIFTNPQGAETVFSGTSANISANTITATGNISCENLTATGTVTAANIDSVNADLAERYISDQIYDAGTVVVFGGEHEITQSQRYADTRIAGVVSTAPAYVMNAAAPGLAIALQGRVPCRVIGTIRKGDLITSSNTSGVATRLRPQDWVPGAVIGKALEDYHSDQPGVIEVVVGRL